MSRGKNVLLVIVDRFSKQAHFVPLSQPYTVVSVAYLFFDYIFKLHGLQETIVNDQDITFISTFWTKLFKLCGTKLAFSLTYHPQSDGQIEMVNHTIEMYLWCFTSDQPTKCMEFLSLGWILLQYKLPFFLEGYPIWSSIWQASSFFAFLLPRKC